MSVRSRLPALIAGASLLSCLSIAIAQEPVGAPSVNNLNPYNLLQKHFIVAGKVTTLRGDPVRGAKVVVEPGVSGEFRVLQTSLQGEFSTEYDLNADLVKEFSVTLVVTKKGLSKAREVIDFGASDKTWVIPVTLAGRFDLKPCAEAEAARSFRGAVG